MKAKKQIVLFTFLPFYLFTFNIIKGMKDEGKEARTLFLPFYPFTFLPLKKLCQTIRKLTPREKRRICREKSSHRSRLE